MKSLMIYLFILAALSLSLLGTTQANDITFTQDIKPIFQRYCIECHVGAVSYEAAYNNRDNILQKLVNLREMPPRYAENRPSENEIELVKQWINSGAKK